MADNKKAEEALRVNELAWKHHEKDEKKEALEHYEQALKLWKEVGDRGREATAMFDMHFLVDEKRALELVQGARDIWADLDAKDELKKADERLAELKPEKKSSSSSRSRSSSSSKKSDDDDKDDEAKKDEKADEEEKKDEKTAKKDEDDAKSKKQPAKEEPKKTPAKSSSASASEKDQPTDAPNLTDEARRQQAAGKHKEALALYQRVLPLWYALNDQAAEAEVLNNIGVIQRALGDHEAALDSYEKALAIWRDLNDLAREAVTCYNIAMVMHKGLKRTDDAVMYMERCVELEQLLKHPDLEADRKLLEELRGG